MEAEAIGVEVVEKLPLPHPCSKGTTFVILINHASTPVKKERLSLTSKARREVSRNEFVEKGGMKD